MDSDSKREIVTGSEEELNKLFVEVLDGVRDDILEAETNVSNYLELLGMTAGIEAYGISYNEALKIKGSARDRQLKFLNMFKDRVSKKEQMKLTEEANKKESLTGVIFNHSDLNKMIEEANIVHEEDLEDEDD